MNSKLWRKDSTLNKDNEEPFNEMKELIGNGQDFAYAYRLACEEGPWHHASSNSVLLNALLKGIRELADQLGISIAPYDGEVVEVLMHRPPHHHVSMHRPPHHHESTHRPPHHHESTHRPPHHHESMHRPPHHHKSTHQPPHDRHFSGNGVYPAKLPVELILCLADGDEQRAGEMIDALAEGAPHHVMANIIIMHIAEALMALAVKRKAAVQEGV